MLKSKELRTKAWDSLKGKYWIAFAATIISGLLISISSCFTTIASEIAGITESIKGVELTDQELLGLATILVASAFIALVGIIIAFFINGPAIIGCCKYFIKNTDSKPCVSDVFSGFKTRYGRNLIASLLIAIKTVLWTLLFIIPGIIKSFEYAIIPYILADDETISTKDAFKKAKEMMRGNKWKLFVLNFSFIGWILICVAIGTIGALICPPLIILAAVGALFLTPYIDAANAQFYVELKNK